MTYEELEKVLTFLVTVNAITLEEYSQIIIKAMPYLNNW